MNPQQMAVAYDDFRFLLGGRRIIGPDNDNRPPRHLEIPQHDRGHGST